jgi:peptidoglycan hydrolase-like protein with peptidoglycan-binding domain
MDRVLSRGSIGTDVMDIQDALNNAPSDLDPLDRDGIFGPLTEARVREFQVDNNLAPGGVVDAATRVALFAPQADLVDEGQIIGQTWVHAAQIAVRELLGAAPDPNDDPVLTPTLDVATAALQIHFHITPDDFNLLLRVNETFNGISNVLNTADIRTGTVFHSVGFMTALADFQFDNNAAQSPAYTFFRGNRPKDGVFFSPTFDARWTWKTRSAMVVHECVHFLNRANDDFALEWPLFNGHSDTGHPNYANLPPEDAVRNPSSYASFSQHVFFRADTRFGAGNNVP